MPYDDLDSYPEKRKSQDYFVSRINGRLNYRIDGRYLGYEVAISYLYADRSMPRTEAAEYLLDLPKIPFGLEPCIHCYKPFANNHGSFGRCNLDNAYQYQTAERAAIEYQEETLQLIADIKSGITKLKPRVWASGPVEDSIKELVSLVGDTFGMKPKLAKGEADA